MNSGILIDVDLEVGLRFGSETSAKSLGSKYLERSRLLQNFLSSFSFFSSLV